MADIADPERALALVYAPAARREALAALWRLDERLGEVLRLAHEPLIRAIRLAWWRESLEKLDAGIASPEPLLVEVTNMILPLGIGGAELAAIEAGWAALADDVDAAAVLAHGKRRGRPLFTLAARLLSGEAASDIADAGEGWSLVDILPRLEDGEARAAAIARAKVCLAPLAGRYWPKPLRALGMLTVLAQRDLRRGDVRQPGAPGRLARALWLSICGR
ncbi:MAG TPA: hypothetical protein VNZ43_15060 [Sphingomonadaceae bacterium]|nr:hypothetical protein [Sphingomonadaceae bacterium]